MSFFSPFKINYRSLKLLLFSKSVNQGKTKTIFKVQKSYHTLRNHITHAYMYTQYLHTCITFVIFIILIFTYYLLTKISSFILFSQLILVLRKKYLLLEKELFLLIKNYSCIIKL